MAQFSQLLEAKTSKAENHKFSIKERYCELDEFVQNHLTTIFRRFKIMASNATQGVSSDIIETQSIDISGITLPAEAVKDLVTIQTDEMKRAVVLVNQNVKVAGAAMRQAMKDLYDIKVGVLGGKRKSNWIAFLESGLLNISPKTARDMVAAYDNWIKKEGEAIPDYVFSNMSARTLAVVSSGSDEQRNLVLSKVRSGEKITEAEARRLINSNKKKTTAPSKLEETETDWDKYCEAEIKKVQEDATLTKEVKSEKVKRIEKKQANMKMIASRFNKLREEVKSLQKLVYSSVDNGNQFKKNDDPFLATYQKLLKDKGVTVLNIEDAVINLEKVNAATKTFSSTKEDKEKEESAAE